MLCHSFHCPYTTKIFWNLVIVDKMIAYRPLTSILTSQQWAGNNIEETANTYNPNACNKVLIKIAKPNLSN
jgi:hypothetical protein